MSLKVKNKKLNQTVNEGNFFFILIKAFGSVVAAWKKTLNVPMEKINPNGGAMAHGHPLGATGAILMTKLVNELERSGKRYGLQTVRGRIV
jgi:acetyl-CoA acyltransferase